MVSDSRSVSLRRNIQLPLVTFRKVFMQPNVWELIAKSRNNTATRFTRSSCFAAILATPACSLGEPGGGWTPRS